MDHQGHFVVHLKIKRAKKIFVEHMKRDHCECISQSFPAECLIQDVIENYSVNCESKD